MRSVPISVVAGLLVLSARTAATQGSDPSDVYRRACVACHGPDGRGQPREIVGFDLELPDFTNCTFATREPNVDWFAIVHRGGPVRAFDRRMPAFGGVLQDEDIQSAVEHLRGFCSDQRWPRGELNLPRALVTEKAYPEDEAVVTVTAAGGEEGAVRSDFLYEHRLGTRSQFEVAVPFDVQKSDGAWQRGLGDVAVAVKRTVFHDLNGGSIFSVIGEVLLPTGKENLGLGKGVTVFEPAVAFGQILPGNGFVQAHAGAELSTNREKSGHEAFWRVAAGKSFVQNRFGRTWSPMIEILGARELDGGEPTTWDLMPEVQITLSRRQHIMFNVGIRVPVNERDDRDSQFVTYLLWDWFDGGFFEGWR